MNLNTLKIIEQKKLLRQQIKERKASADRSTLNQLSGIIFDQVEQTEEFRNSKTILAYWSLPDEVQTHDFVMKWYQKKRVLLPLVVGDILEIRHFTGLDCMEKGPAFGILEPRKGVVASIDEAHMVIVPGLAFDLNGNRMGRGKGYYDKLLKGKEIFRVGVCFSFQVVAQVPVDNFDIPMNKVIFNQ